MTPKPVKTVKEPSAAWAEQLWRRLESNLLNAQNTIIAIIEARAWEPLGYESFSKAWIDRIMPNVTLSAELRPHVVYQMFSEGLTPDQIADIVKGISPETVKNLKRQKDNGLAADEVTVHEHQRKSPSSWTFLHLKVDTETLQAWKIIAEENNGTVKEIALEAVTAMFDELAH